MSFAILKPKSKTLNPILDCSDDSASSSAMALRSELPVADIRRSGHAASKCYCSEMGIGTACDGVAGLSGPVTEFKEQGWGLGVQDFYGLVLRSLGLG